MALAVLIEMTEFMVTHVMTVIVVEILELMHEVRVTDSLKQGVAYVSSLLAAYNHHVCVLRQ